MRSKSTHAVWSGVGESAARESESAKCRYSGKSAWRTPTPHFNPENFGSLGFFVARHPGETAAPQLSSCAE